MIDTVFILDGTGAHHLRLMRFLENEMPERKMRFLFCGVSCSEEKLEGYRYASVVSDFTHPPKEIKNLLASCRRIIVVGLFDPGLVAYLFLHNALLHKTVVALHGGEFYSIRGTLSLKMKLYQCVRRSVISKMHSCYTFTPDDYIFAAEYYNLPERHGYVELPWHFNVTPEVAALDKPTDPYVIMVGHNAHQEGNHQRILRTLARFKDENIKIIAPLSYGPEENRDDVINLGKSIFGEKFLPLTSWIQSDEYEQMLRTVSVFVMGIDRQAGTFNTNLMLRLGCKVYARSDTSIWTYFTQYCGCELFDIESVGRVGFDEFVSFSQQQRLANSESMFEKLTPESCLRTWENAISSW